MGAKLLGGHQNDYLKSVTYSIVLFLLTLPGYNSLKCYQCISIECSETQLFCENVKEYVLSQLPDLYYGYEKVPICPSPNENDVGWEELRRETHNDCEEEKADEATCVLGRFRVTTELYETGKNITSHGTSMGCAKPALLKMTREAVKKGECDISSTTSKFKHSLRHYLEIEHCARAPDMCHGAEADFCISPYSSKIKKFQDEPKKTPFPFTLILGIFLIIALAVIVLTFLAPYCNG